MVHPLSARAGTLKHANIHTSCTRSCIPFIHGIDGILSWAASAIVLPSVFVHLLAQLYQGSIICSIWDPSLGCLPSDSVSILPFVLVHVLVLHHQDHSCRQVMCRASCHTCISVYVSLSLSLFLYIERKEKQKKNYIVRRHNGSLLT